MEEKSKEKHENIHLYFSLFYKSLEKIEDMRRKVEHEIENLSKKKDIHTKNKRE